MTTAQYSVAETLHHEAPMILLDEILSFDQDTVSAATTITADTPFMENGVVPAYVAIEYMAQTIGIYNGIECLKAGLPVRIGYLLGSRSLQLYRPYFQPSERLEVAVTAIYKDEEMFSFDCKVKIGCELVAEAVVNAYSPNA